MFRPGHLEIVRDPVGPWPGYHIDLDYEVEQRDWGTYVRFDLRGDISGRSFQECFELHRDVAYNFLQSACRRLRHHGLEPHLIARDAKGDVLAERRWTKDGTITHETLLEDLLREIEASVGDDLIAVGHRIVHGGTDYSAPARVDAPLLAALEALCPLAPLHQPHNLAAVRAGSVAADHSLLRKLGALCDRLPSLKSDGAFEEAFLRDYNDALAAAFLATATKNAAAVNDLSDKFVLVNARGSKLV